MKLYDVQRLGSEMLVYHKGIDSTTYKIGMALTEVTNIDEIELDSSIVEDAEIAIRKDVYSASTRGQRKLRSIACRLNKLQKLLNPTYKIVRHFLNTGTRRTIRLGLTLQQARAHCSDPETSSRHCKGHNAKRRTWRNGPWFDGYDKE